MLFLFHYLTTQQNNFIDSYTSVRNTCIIKKEKNKKWFTNWNQFQINYATERQVNYQTTSAPSTVQIHTAI